MGAANREKQAESVHHEVRTLLGQAVIARIAEDPRRLLKFLVELVGLDERGLGLPARPVLVADEPSVPEALYQCLQPAPCFLRRPLVCSSTKPCGDRIVPGDTIFDPGAQGGSV